MAGRHSPAPSSGDASGRSPQQPMRPSARHSAARPPRPNARRAHSAPPARGPRRRFIAAGAAALAAATTVLIASSWRDDSGHAGANGTGGCRGEVRLSVIAAPSIAPAIAAIAAGWLATRPASEGVCVRVSVTALTSQQAEQALVHVSTAAVWIPDSTVWSSRLTADASSLTRSRLVVGPSVATSPLVVAATPARSAAVAAAASTGWRGALSGSTRVALPSPADTTEGALALLALESQLGTSAAATDTLGTILLQLTERVVPNTAAGFSAVKDYPTTAPAFVATEQQVLATNEESSAPLTNPVYPRGAGPALDFPFVTITPSPDSVYAHALREFQLRLASPTAMQSLHAVHLRDATAAPIKHGTGVSGGGDVPVRLTAQPTAALVTTVLRRWAAVSTAHQLLTVVDVSGSMNDDSGNGQSKISATCDAVATAVTSMPDAWSAGLWTFSSKQPPASDWTELVALGSVQSQRAALLTAVRTMPDRVGGDAGLYSTALAAFRAANAQYDAHKTNAVVLLTDGANVGGIAMPTLLAKLRAARDPRRPVSIMTIALGRDADVAALRQISAATGGRSYVVHRAQDIPSVFVRIALGS